MDLYHPFYCEENVWHLCQDPRLAGRSPRAVFIGNAAGAIVMWNQRAARGPGRPMFWDYHVVVLAEGPWEVWDRDSLLGEPVPAAAYLAESFHPGVPPDFLPRFRLVDGAELVLCFASDRSHMRTRSGAYRRPPPPWPPIGAAGAASNLHRFLDMEAPFVGEVLELDALAARVA